MANKQPVTTHWPRWLRGLAVDTELKFQTCSRHLKILIPEILFPLKTKNHCITSTTRLPHKLGLRKRNPIQAPASTIWNFTSLAPQPCLQCP